MTEQERQQCKQQRLEIALPILQGLLASGHYSFPAELSESGEIIADAHPLHKKLAANWKDWYPRKYQCLAIQDALDVAEELEGAIEKQISIEESLYE